MEKDEEETSIESASDSEEEGPDSEEEEEEEEGPDSQEEEEGPDKKRPHLLNNNSSPSIMARHSSAPHDQNNTPVDAGVLQYQNQRLVQQLDAQKHEIHDLETKMEEIKHKQDSYDNVLITVNSLWNQLVDDLILLGVRAGAGKDVVKHLDQADHCRGFVPQCPAEEIFVCRLLETISPRSDGNEGSIGRIKEALDLRHSSTLKLMKSLEETIDAERAKIENTASLLKGEQSAEDTIIKFARVDDLMKEEAKKLNEVIDVLHSKHKEYCDAIDVCNRSHSDDVTQIKSISGDLEERMAELEESRRKLINLKMQKDLASPIQAPAPVTANGSVSPDKPTEKAKHLRVLKDYVEEAKVLTDDRLSELQDARDDNSKLVKQLQELQTELREDKHIRSSRPYTLVHDQLHHWTAEAERYRALTDSQQADRPSIMRREKELIAKIESADAARKVDNSEEKIEELEHEVQKCITEKNELEIRMEEAMQDSGRQDIKAEFDVMASSLSKEIKMLEAQLNRWKATAEEANSLRQEAQSLKILLEEKVGEQKTLADKCSQGMVEIKSLKALIESRQREKQELQIVLDMLGQQIYDNRDLMDIKESEQKANAQAELLRNALDEHGLELRVKAANEAEIACQLRLSTAEAEIAELRAVLDDSERHVSELREAIKVKEDEAETYICEIETIGQSYEDMQTQHQHLLQQVTDRDDYNIKLVSESVMAKQAHSLLTSEKQSLAKQLQQANTRLESLRSRITQSEEQMKVLIMDALSSIPEDRRIALHLETTRWELTDAEKELKWLKSAVSSSEKEHEQMLRKTEEIQTELESERSERQKLDEEILGLNEQIAEMTSGSREAAVQRLQDEINECKAILKCGVCLDRPKEVVIVKCYHLFCNQCIQRNLEIRHRRCPGCGTAFGQNDVRFVKI